MERNPAELTTTNIAGVLAAAGVVTFALFPLAIPFLLLTVVFTAPLVLIGVVAALPVVLIAGAVLAIRALGRLAANGLGASGQPSSSARRRSRKRRSASAWTNSSARS